MNSPHYWIADAAALLARLEQVVFACAAPALHEHLVALLRQRHAEDLESENPAVLLPCAEGRSPAFLTWSGMFVTPQPMPGEALVHGAALRDSAMRADEHAARTQAREAAREGLFIARAPRPARELRAELLARRPPYK